MGGGKGAPSRGTSCLCTLDYFHWVVAGGLKPPVHSRPLFRVSVHRTVCMCGYVCVSCVGVRPPLGPCVPGPLVRASFEFIVFSLSGPRQTRGHVRDGSRRGARYSWNAKRRSGRSIGRGAAIPPSPVEYGGLVVLRVA